MKSFDIKVPCTLTISVNAHSADEVRRYVHEAFKASRASDALAGVRFSIDAYAIEKAMQCEIATCVIDVPPNELEVTEN